MLQSPSSCDPRLTLSGLWSKGSCPSTIASRCLEGIIGAGELVTQENTPPPSDRKLGGPGSPFGCGDEEKLLTASGSQSVEMWLRHAASDRHCRLPSHLSVVRYSTQTRGLRVADDIISACKQECSLEPSESPYQERRGEMRPPSGKAGPLVIPVEEAASRC